MVSGMTKLESVIAVNVIDLREKAGKSQADLAAAMTSLGFAWSTNRVSQVETLRRPVSLIEAVGLAQVFGVRLSRLVAGSGRVGLPDGSMPLKHVREAVSGEDPGVWIAAKDQHELAAAHTNLDELRKLAAKLGISQKELDEQSRDLFGQPFWDERDERTGDTTGMSPRSAQTKRGHASRAMLAEIREHLERKK